LHGLAAGDDGGPHPSGRRIDEAVVSTGKHFDFVTKRKVEYPQGVSLTDVPTDKAVDFVERRKDGPFFLCLDYFGVHASHQAKPDLVAGFKRRPPASGHKDPATAGVFYSRSTQGSDLRGHHRELGRKRRPGRGGARRTDGGRGHGRHAAAVV
jgi:hypothetical protein